MGFSDAMSSNLARLQTLGSALGKEIDDQNQLLDDIQRKTDKTDTTVRNQVPLVAFSSVSFYQPYIFAIG